jgi:hypothetical protein
VTALQLDLFAADTGTRRLVDGLTALRDVVPEALEAVVNLGDRGPDDRQVGRSGAWWYAARRDGLHFAGLDEQLRGRGWPSTLPRRITWAELAEQLADDPRRAELLSWAQSLPMPNWRELIRPFELWPDPDSWHPDYITGDHERPGWDERITAWTTLQAILTDAITRLHPAGGA